MLTRPRRNSLRYVATLAVAVGATVPAVPMQAAAAPGGDRRPASAAASAERGRSATGADTTPPTRPGLSVARDVSLTWATISVLTPSSDDTAVAGYVVQRRTDGSWTDVASNNISSVYLRDLTPATTYTVVVVAFDAAGNRSPQSDPVTFTTRAVQPAPTCQVQLVSFGTGYLANVSVENMTLTPLAGWYVTFVMPAPHTVLNTAGGAVTRTGDQARINPASWATTLGPGVRAGLMVNAAKPISAPDPSGFRLNGTVDCSFTR